ncbi:collagenase [Burkholderia lata]|nr:collagenase [Burkholderia lata]
MPRVPQNLPESPVQALHNLPLSEQDRAALTRHSPGAVNLPVVRRGGGEGVRHSESRRRILGEFGEFVPRNETGFELFAIKRGVQQMSLEPKVLPDRTEARQKSLRSFRVTEPAHAPLALTGRLMTILGPVIHACSSIDEHVFDAGQLGDLGLRGRIAS